MKIHAMLGLATLFVGFSTQEGGSLLCSHCNCTKTADDGIVDVDCTEKFINYDVLYDNKSWLDEQNAPYRFGRVVLKLSDLPDLTKPFPFSNLTHLDLSKNFIRTIQDGCFAQLQNMSVLVLSDNEIDTLKPDVFKGLRTDGNNYPLRSLTTLKLDNNRLHTLNDDLFEHLDQVLKVLDLSYNPFKVIDQPTALAIGGIIYLEELNLAYTGIKKLPEHFLHTPKHLKRLDLSGNSFTSIPEGLTDVHTLETLVFNTNPIVNLTAENGFKNISTLKTLYLCNMLELEYIGARSIASLENLSELYIYNNMKLSHIDAAALSRIVEETEIWPPITKLSLRNNQLTTIDFHLLIRWDALKEFDLTYNPWTCECENQWIADTLMPIYVKINEDVAKQIKCEAPIEMVGHTFYEEYTDNKKMRCLDLYGNRPERDGTILIGVLLGLLLGIPLVLLVIFAYQRNWFGVCEKGPAAYSRQFYRRTRSDEL